MRLTSTAFTAGATIPSSCTCEGENVSPPLAWTGTPAGTRSLALVVDDPDAPRRRWVHWVIWNLPPAMQGLPPGVSNDATLAGGGRQGRNDFGRVGYGGPCPPPGPAHHYVFTLFALDAVLGLAPGATRAELSRAMDGHVLATAELVGTFRRR
jgi:Raf kinase inhibitor-like YbhB/YbcL family protein